VQSDEGDELVMRAPDSDALAAVDRGDRVLVTYTEAAIVAIQPVEDADQLLRGQKGSGTSNDMESSDQENEDESEDGSSGRGSESR